MRQAARLQPSCGGARWGCQLLAGQRKTLERLCRYITRPALAILGACLAWGVDINLTRKVALKDANWIASVKGLVAGCVNLVLAFTLGETLPGGLTVLTAMTMVAAR
jgi:hypothetical protein